MSSWLHMPRDDLAFDDQGASELHRVARLGKDYLEMCRKLQSAYHDCPEGISSRDAHERTPLHWAAMAGNSATLQAFLKIAKPKDLNAIDKEGRSGLHLAMIFCRSELQFRSVVDFATQLRVMHGSLVEKAWGPLSSETEAAEIMKDYCLYRDVKGSMIRADSSWDAEAADLWEQSIDDMPAIYLALCAERSDLAQFIQSDFQAAKKHVGVDAVNSPSQKTGRSALHWAALQGRLSIVEQLYSTTFGSALSPNQEDKHGSTALEYAVEKKWEQIEKKLKQREDVKAHQDKKLKKRRDDGLADIYAKTTVSMAILVWSITQFGAPATSLLSLSAAVLSALSLGISFACTLIGILSGPYLRIRPVNSHTTVQLVDGISKLLSTFLAICIACNSFILALPAILHFFTFSRYFGSLTLTALVIGISSVFLKAIVLAW